MPDYPHLMSILSRPRPNGSRGERRALQDLKTCLERSGIAYCEHIFRNYPHFFEALGAWLILSRSLLALAVWLRWGWPALLIALLSLPGGLVDIGLNVPLVTWPGARTGVNLLIPFEPRRPDMHRHGPGTHRPGRDAVLQEILISAHYDTKTELLDHRQRLFFLKNLPLGILLTVLVGLAGLIDGLALSKELSWAGLAHGLGIALSLPLLFLAWGLGLSLSLGRLRAPSLGAVDNGAACAILLGLAERVQRGELELKNSRLTLALFTGEEVNMQGSRAYLGQRHGSLPAWALNLEVMAQDGDYVFWEKEGSVLRLAPTSARLNRLLEKVVAEVTGMPPRPAGPITSDGASFLKAGIPVAVLGTYHSTLVDRGFHCKQDCLERVSLERLPEGEEILARFVQQLDDQALQTEAQ